VLKTDVSNYVIRMCISQPDLEGRLQLITFYSWKMIPMKLNYKIHDKELLAIIIVFSE
jgi:RNase H-like domain found in reverse transcriptase